MYEIKIKQFSGPLDLLMQLIDDKKMEITELSLSEVTENYLAHLEQVENNEPEELADFLYVASRLLLLKSKALLPVLVDEEPADDLARQLKLYKEFIEASKKIKDIIAAGHFSFSREKAPWELKVEFAPPPSTAAADLRAAMVAVLKRLNPVVKLPRQTMEKTVSLREKILHLREFLAKTKTVSFGELLSQAKNRTEVIISFLAILELLKERSCAVKQKGSFGNILIERI